MQTTISMFWNLHFVFEWKLHSIAKYIYSLVIRVFFVFVQIKTIEIFVKISNISKHHDILWLSFVLNFAFIIVITKFRCRPMFVERVNWMIQYLSFANIHEALFVSAMSKIWHFRGNLNNCHTDLVMKECFTLTGQRLHIWCHSIPICRARFGSKNVYYVQTITQFRSFE